MRYDFYRKVAKILARSNSDMLFDYIIHCMDDNGFLRTRWCYWDDEVLENYKGSDDINTTLVTMKYPFDFEEDTRYYIKDEVTGELLPRFEMQLFLEDLSDDEAFMEEARWSAEAGYSLPIKIDIINETYQIMTRVNL